MKPRPELIALLNRIAAAMFQSTHRPGPAGALRDRLEDLLRQAGIPAGDARRIARAAYPDAPEDEEEDRS